MSKSSPHDALHTAAGQPVALGEILSALSFALDITEGARPGHSVRSCLLGMRLGKQIGLSDQALAALYYALLLKDIGCSSNSARMAAAFAADDQVVKRHFKFIDREKLGKPNREALTFVWNNIAPAANVWDSHPPDVSHDPQSRRSDRRGDRGAVRTWRRHSTQAGNEESTPALRFTRWTSTGMVTVLPDHLVAQDIPLLGRICAVSQDLELFCSEFGSARRDRHASPSAPAPGMNPDLVRAAESLHQQGDLWAAMRCPAATPRRCSPPCSRSTRAVPPALAARDIDLICSGFADVIDAKSPFTYRHAVGTTEAAVLISNAMGLAPDRVDVVRRAALLHDIGMLGVPNTILDKQGTLTGEAWRSIHRHPVLSQEILARVRAFSETAILAGQHHEKLDGSGYPFHLAGAQLSVESRILTVADVFNALMESRPYRPDLTPAEIQQQLALEVPHRLDPECVDAVLSVLDQLAGLPLEDIPAMSADTLPDIVMVEPPPFRFGAASR